MLNVGLNEKERGHKMEIFFNPNTLHGLRFGNNYGTSLETFNMFIGPKCVYRYMYSHCKFLMLYFTCFLINFTRTLLRVKKEECNNRPTNNALILDDAILL